MISDGSADKSRARTAGQFTTTHWSVVLAAGGDTSPQSREALERLCQSYWYPLYAYTRRHGSSSQDAEDLVQDFFAQLVDKHYVADADPGRGRFRSFLLMSFRHFLANDWDRRQTAKRGGGKQFLSWEGLNAEERYAAEAAHELTPDKLYERAWAWSVLERVRSRLRKEYVTLGKGERFEQLAKFLPGSSSDLTYAELSARSGQSEVALRSEVHRLRRRFGVLLRAEIADLVGNEGEIDEELNSLIAAIAT